MLLIITSIGDRLFRFFNIDDLKRPWTPQKEVFSDFFLNFFMQRTFQQWIATKWQGIDQDNLRMKFSPLNVDFSSSSPDPLDSRRPAQAGVRQFPLPLKSRPSYFTAIISCSVKTVPDEHRHAACHNKQQWQAFCWCQHRWPWMTLNLPKRSF